MLETGWNTIGLVLGKNELTISAGFRTHIFEDLTDSSQSDVENLVFGGKVTGAVISSTFQGIIHSVQIVSESLTSQAILNLYGEKCKPISP